MEELIECNNFDGRPNVEAKDFVLYFNLEYGLEFSEDEASKYVENDFKFIGFFLSKSGQESMYWSVSNKSSVYAVALPLTNGKHILSMTDVDPNTLSLIEVLA